MKEEVMFKKILIVTAPLILVLFANPLLFAQQGEGSCAITGAVLDNKGKPVKGAALNINCNEHGFHENMKTGKDGTYGVENLKAGFYSIILKKGKSWNSRHKMERLEPGQAITLDFAPLTDAGALCGEILDLKGKPIKNCTVRLNNINYYQKARVEMVNDNTETDSTGFFVFDNLPPCQYVVNMYKRGVVQSSPAGSFQIEKGVEKEVTIKIQPGTAKGKVKFQGHRPAGKTNINLWAVKEGDFGGPQWSTNPEESGAFELMNLSPGSYEVKATSKGYYCKPVIFKVSKKGKVKEFEILLKKAGTILFKVTDRKGNPLAHINVSKVIPGKGSSSVLMDKVKDGHFRVFSIEPGKHEFHVSASGKGNATESVTVKAAEEAVVDVKI
jgi:hypothetical protein